MCVVCACRCLCWLLLLSSREGISAAPPALTADLSTNYNLSVDFHGSEWSRKRKGFHFPDHEIFTIKSLFLESYVFVIGVCVSGVLEWCPAVFTMKIMHKSAILLDLEYIIGGFFLVYQKTSWWIKANELQLNQGKGCSLAEVYLNRLTNILPAFYFALGICMVDKM